MSFEDTPDYRLLDVGISTPLLNAPGSINGTSQENILREVSDLSKTDIGIITIGSIGLIRNEGNAAIHGEPVYYIDEVTGLTYNAVKLANIGLDALKELWPDVRSAAGDKPINLSLAPLESTDKDLGDPVSQIVRLVKGAQELDPEFMEIDVSCPSILIPQGDKEVVPGHDFSTMSELEGELQNVVRPDQRVGLHLPQYISNEQRTTAVQIGYMLRRSRVIKFLDVCNSVTDPELIEQLGGEPHLSIPGGIGSLSGPETAPIGREQLLFWRTQVPSDLAIISTEGVASGKEMRIRLDLGAKAVGGVTFLWRTTNWCNAVTQMLVEFSHYQIVK